MGGSLADESRSKNQSEQLTFLNWYWRSEQV